MQLISIPSNARAKGTHSWNGRRNGGDRLFTASYEPEIFEPEDVQANLALYTSMEGGHTPTL